MQKNDNVKMDPKAKSTIKIVFFTLFMDLIGFSIIFPMFPQLAKFYLENDPDNYWLKLIFSFLDSVNTPGHISMNTIVLFGGILGALYSLLQFFAAPFWGGLSDKYGRKPILLISVFGLFVSYVMWFFSGSFTLLILARLIGGIMGGNLSVATAAVADVTTKETRSRGMAFVGIAFALGFIVGPAIGGILTLFNPLDVFQSLATYGVNPFSYAALVAGVLSLINFFFILFKFEETRSVNTKAETQRSANIFKLFSPLAIKDVNLVNYSYFFFILAFSGMEFTLTFLATERFNFTSMDNAYMFIFIGVLLTLVQGGYVRRKAHSVGEKKMALQGLSFVATGLVIIGFSSSVTILYLGLGFLAVGSSMSIPTMTSLVSLRTPDHLQGRSLGIFRSLGSLGRVFGPIAASLLYYQLGGAKPYYICAAFLSVPILILLNLKKEVQNDKSIDQNKI